MSEIEKAMGRTRAQRRPPPDRSEAVGRLWPTPPSLGNPTSQTHRQNNRCANRVHRGCLTIQNGMDMGERFLTESTLIRQYLFGGEVPPTPPNSGHHTDWSKGLTPPLPLSAREMNQGCTWFTIKELFGLWWQKDLNYFLDKSEHPFGQEA